VKLPGATHLVVLARFIGEPIKNEIESIITSMGLNLNEKKTRILDLNKGDILNFLGYSIRISRDKNRRITIKPSDKAIARLRDKIREIISRERLYHGLKGIIAEINPVLRGWKQYFKLTNVSRIFLGLNFYITARFYRVGRKTSQRYSKIFKPGVYVTLRKMGLYCLATD